MKLDELNKELSSDYQKPEYTENGFRFFFQGYVPSMDDGDDSLVGLALAWPEPNSPDHKRKYFVCSTRKPPCEYQKGDVFDVDKTLTSNELSRHPGMFKYEKLKAMEKLRELVSSSVLESA